MKHISWYAGCLILCISILTVSACLKNSFPVVGPPDDVKGDSTTTPPEKESVQRKVLIIGIDGCRGDALEVADVPHIHSLLPHAIYSFDALTDPPTWSGPGWSSMLTGVWSNKHGVKDNSFSGNHLGAYPSIFKYIKRINPKEKIVSICSWAPINEYLMNNADIRINTNEDDKATKDSAISHLENDDPDIMFLHFDDVDHAGHQFGFDTTVSEYMQAISKVDAYIGEVLQALNKRPEISKEDWLIIISTDHGGNINGHGGNTYAEKNIFTIFYNKHFPSKELVPPENTLSSVYFQSVNQSGQVIDNTNSSSFLDFDSYAGFTLQVEVQAPSPLQKDDPILTNKDWNSGSNRGWVIAVDGQSWKFNAGGNHSRIDIDADAPDLSDGKWHNIAVTVDKDGYIQLYQDDSLYNYSSVKGVLGNTWSTGSNVKLATGDDITGGYRASWGVSKFIVANIRVWDTVLSLDDMKAYASSCDTAISPDNPFINHLVGWWKGTEGKGDLFKDYGPYGVDMQLYGDPAWIKQQLDLCNQPLPPSVPTIVDIAPSILAWLKIPVDPGWGLAGISWLPD